MRRNREVYDGLLLLALVRVSKATISLFFITLRIGERVAIYVKLNYSQAISLHVRRFKNEFGKRFIQSVFVKVILKFDKSLLENIERNS